MGGYPDDRRGSRRRGEDGGTVCSGEPAQVRRTGIVIAVTGVGAGDMVSSLVAGTDFGMVLIWAVILGAILKYFLTEGIGRWYMVSGQTILQGWRSLGRWAIWYFVVYLFIVTFVFGVAVASTAALAVDAALPGVLPLWAWAALHSVAAFAVVSIGRYGLFERIMKTFAALKFGIVILLASCSPRPLARSSSGSSRGYRRAP